MELLVKILATWRLSALLVYDRGPFRIFQRLREEAGVLYLDKDGWPSGFWGQLLSCTWCVSVWVAVLVWLIDKTPLRWALKPLALSGGAILLDEVRQWHEQT